MVLTWHLYVMAALYFLAGLNHFRKPKMYERIIPPYIPFPKQANYASGIGEITLAALLCFPPVSHYAAWGIVALLIAVFPANLYMYLEPKASFHMPKWVLLARLPLQIVLMAWAYYYTL